VRERERAISRGGGKEEKKGGRRRQKKEKATGKRSERKTQTNKRKEKIEYVLSILNNNESYTKLFNFINNPDVVCAQISQPNTNSSNKKHITCM
jgi:hypothetical protein